MNSASDILEIILDNKKGLPNLKYRCLDIFGDKDKICFVGYFSEKHEGEIMGIQPTGKIMAGTFCQVYIFKDNKLFSTRLFNDSLSLFQQIGRAVMVEKNKDQVQKYLALLQKFGLVLEKAIIPNN